MASPQTVLQLDATATAALCNVVPNETNFLAPLAEDLQAVRDGTLFNDGVMDARVIADKTRSLSVTMYSSHTGSTNGEQVVNYGGSILFESGVAPDEFARCSFTVPLDYAGGDITIKIGAWTESSMVNLDMEEYQSVKNNGDDMSASPVTTFWNVKAGVAFQTTFVAPDLGGLFLTISSASIAAGSLISFAVRPTVALIDDLFFNRNAVVEYTADS